MSSTALVPTFEGQLNNARQPLCNGRDLHRFLEVGRDFSTWIKNRIEQYGFVEELDYLTARAGSQESDFSPNPARNPNLDSPKRGNQVHGGDRRSIDYLLSLGMAKELAMIENNDRGREVRRYFIRMEEQAKANVPSIGVVRQYGLRHPSALLTPEEKLALLEARPDWKAIQALVLEGLNGNEIADKLGSARNTVYNKISRMRMCGILPPDPRRVALKIERAMRAITLEQEQEGSPPH